MATYLNLKDLYLVEFKKKIINNILIKCHYVKLII